LPIQFSTRNFVLTTFSFFECGLHEIAAVFVYGREGITPVMFLPLIEQLEEAQNYQNQPELSTLIYYFNRHIELDHNDHFPKALRMLANLIGDDPQKLVAAKNAATKALNARIAFLTGIQHSLHPSSELRMKVKA
jgi:hypothetical protein